MRLNSDRTIGVWGLVANQNFDVGKSRIEVGNVNQDYATILLTSKDNQPILSSRQMLLLASSSAQNTGMVWNEDRNSIGEDWGSGPTLINPVNAKIRLAKDGLAGMPKVFALDGTGRRTGEVSVAVEDNGYVIAIGGDYKTLWYEVTVE